MSHLRELRQRSMATWGVSKGWKSQALICFWGNVRDHSVTLVFSIVKMTF